MPRCIHCEESFEPRVATTTMCRACYFSGRHFEITLPGIADLLRDLRAIPNLADASLEHTGGGCWALMIKRTDDFYLLATDAYPDGQGGWDTSPEIPATADGPWMVGGYDPEGEPINRPDVLVPVDRLTLMAIARGWIDRTDLAGLTAQSSQESA